MASSSSASLPVGGDVAAASSSSSPPARSSPSPSPSPSSPRPDGSDDEMDIQHDSYFDDDDALTDVEGEEGVVAVGGRSILTRMAAQSGYGTLSASHFQLGDDDDADAVQSSPSPVNDGDKQADGTDAAASAFPSIRIGMGSHAVLSRAGTLRDFTMGRDAEDVSDDEDAPTVRFSQEDEDDDEIESEADDVVSLAPSGSNFNANPLFGQQLSNFSSSSSFSGNILAGGFDDSELAQNALGLDADAASVMSVKPSPGQVKSSPRGHQREVSADEDEPYLPVNIRIDSSEPVQESASHVESSAPSVSPRIGSARVFNYGDGDAAVAAGSVDVGGMATASSASGASGGNVAVAEVAGQPLSPDVQASPFSPIRFTASLEHTRHIESAELETDDVEVDVEAAATVEKQQRHHGHVSISISAMDESKMNVAAEPASAPPVSDMSTPPRHHQRTSSADSLSVPPSALSPKSRASPSGMLGASRLESALGSAAASGIHRTPRGSFIVRPAASLLSPETVHNPGNADGWIEVGAAVALGIAEAVSPSAAASTPNRATPSPPPTAGHAKGKPSFSLSSSGAHHRRGSSLFGRSSTASGSEGGAHSSIPQEYRAEIESLLSVSDARSSALSFPYALDVPTKKDAPEHYQLVGSFPPCIPSPDLAKFVEPSTGVVVSTIKNEQHRTPLISDAIFDRNEKATRFTRAPRPREFPPAKTLKGLASLAAELNNARSKHDQIECLVLFNERSHPLKDAESFMIEHLPNLKTLQLQEMKIRSWKRPIVLPNLLNLDARRCKVKDVRQVSQICLNSPHLYSLTIAENPVCEKFIDPLSKKATLPPVEHPIWKQLLLRLPNLEYFNLIPIDNATRVRAWMHTKSKKLYPIVGSTIWHQSLNASNPVMNMVAAGNVWRADLVAELNLSGQNLLVAHLYPLRHTIRKLDLSRNNLAALVGSGLHTCTKLEELNLSHNKLVAPDELYMLGHLPLLKKLWLAGNAGLGSSYATLAVYYTRHLFGSNRHPGLLELDGQAVSKEFRLTAFERHAPKGKEQVSEERWRLSIIECVGHVQWKTMANKIVTLHLPNCNLTYADVSAFTSLQQLDLRSNNLKTIEGLHLMSGLRFIDVRFNPELMHKVLIAQLQVLRELEWVSLAHNDEECLDFTGLRAKFLLSLLPHCPKLAILDHRLVTLAEFVKVFRKSRGLSKDAPLTLQYALGVGLVMSNLPFAQRRYDLEFVTPNISGKSGVHSKDARALVVTNLGLVDEFLQQFELLDMPNLTLLNLSYNKLSSLNKIPFSRLPKLKWLDLRGNKFKVAPAMLASAISSCVHLRGLAFAGNPVSGSYTKFRSKLIAAIPDLASLQAELRIIDQHVSIEERVVAWGVASSMLHEEGKSPNDDEAAAEQKVVASSSSAAVDEEKRSQEAHAKSRAVATMRLTQDNRHISALAKRTMRVQKENQISAVQRPLVEPEPSKGVDGAVASTSSSSSPASPQNAALLAMHSSHAVVSPVSSVSSKRGRHGRGSSGSGSGSGIGGLFSSRKEQEALESSIFRFHLALQEACPPATASGRVTELHLGGYNLSWVDFHSFMKLTKLIIANNALTSLAGCGIETLAHLKVLDAHNNKLSNLGEVVYICNQLPQLEYIAFYKNPFCVFDSGVVSPTMEKASVAMGLVVVDEEGHEVPSAASSPSSASGPLSPSSIASPSPSHAPLSPLSPPSAVSTPRLASGAVFTSEKYRLTFIGHLQQLQTPSRKLKYLDNLPVSEDEIVRGLKELGHSPIQRELFRFRSLVFGMDGMDEKCVKLDLHGRKLQRADFSKFPHLTSLNLHNNLYTEDALMESGLAQFCPNLTELDLRGNQLQNKKKLATFINSFMKLKSIRMVNNPAYKFEAEKTRRHMLAAFNNIHMTSFKLEYLNQQKISIEERIDALHYALTHWSIHASDASENQALSPIASPDSPGMAKRGSGVSGQAMAPSPSGVSGKAMSPRSGSKSSMSVAAASPSPDSAIIPISTSDDPDDPAPVAPVPAPQSGPPSLQSIILQGGLPMDPNGDLFAQCENARFILTCHEVGVQVDATELHLRKKKLRMLGGWDLGISRYESLTTVDLRDNHLTDLRHSGIEHLKSMHTLDLRVNEFQHLDTLIASLRGCNALRFLYIQYATKNNEETSTPSDYTQVIFSHLRGLERCDEIKNPTCIHLDPLAKSAQQLLWKIARIGPNNLKRVDLSNRRLPTYLFYDVLSALNYLGVQELLAGGNNEWIEHPQYSDVIIIMLGPQFHWLDGVEITDETRMLAYRADKQGKESGKITGNTVVWNDEYESIHASVDEWIEDMAQVDRGEALERAGSSKNVGEHDVDWRLSMPASNAGQQLVSHPGAGASASAGASAAASSANTSTLSSVLSKVEIAIKYVQVYGMVLVMDINIPYPQAFKDFSAWVRLSTLNLEDLFDFNVAYQKEILFGVVMATPALLLLLYWYFNRLSGREKEWAHAYIDRWSFIKWRAFALWLVGCIIAIACSLLLISNQESIDRMNDGGQPTPESLTWCLLFLAFLSLWYLIWFKIVRTFQRHWTMDKGANKVDFKQKWLNLCFWAQIILLLAITALYLPVARVILIQFSCDYVPDPNDSVESRLSNADECFPNSVNGMQVAAFLFGTVYIIGLPLFLIRLIREGIAVVMNLNTLHERLGREIRELKMENKKIKNALKQEQKNFPTLDNHGTANKPEVEARLKRIQHHETLIAQNVALIERKSKQQRREYFHRINDPIRKLASTSLYAAYEYPYRFWKIFQLAQALLLVCISLFVPATWGGFDQPRLLLGLLVIATCLGAAAFIRPYYDNYENWMEILAGMANLITVFVALGLEYHLSWLTTSRADTILLVANVAACAAFVLVIVIVPFRIWRQKRRARKAAKDAERRIRELNKRKAEERKKKAAARKAAKEEADKAAAAAAVAQSVSPQSASQPHPAPSPTVSPSPSVSPSTQNGVGVVSSSSPSPSPGLPAAGSNIQMTPMR